MSTGETVSRGKKNHSKYKSNVGGGGFNGRLVGK